MKIRIFAVGKIKDFYKLGVEEYLKRLQPYVKCEIIEVKDEPISDSPHESEITKAKEIECSRVLKLLKPNDYVISLDLNQKEYTSEEFASFIDKKIQEHSVINFVIGGSYGLSKQMKERANTSISLSKFTFLHQMSRLILLEQIYRSYKILSNETYHK